MLFLAPEKPTSLMLFFVQTGGLAWKKFMCKG